MVFDWPNALTSVLSFSIKRMHNVLWQKQKLASGSFRIADDDWSIQADYPDSEQRTISGLTSKEDANEWINGERKIAWLRSQGYAK